MEEEKMRLEEPDFDYAGKYSYADYLRWTIDIRLELIRGKIFAMSAPGRVHQTLVARLTGPLWSHLRGQACQVFPSPFDVRFPRKSGADEDVFTVLQPDVCVVCNPEKLDARGCIGAPDIVVEILSRGNHRKELKSKYEVYEESGVREYWVVSPEAASFSVHSLRENGRYGAPRRLTRGDTVTTAVLPGFELELNEYFEGIG